MQPDFLGTVRSGELSRRYHPHFSDLATPFSKVFDEISPW